MVRAIGIAVLLSVGFLGYAVRDSWFPNREPSQLTPDTPVRLIKSGRKGDKNVHELMEKVHKGRNSPFGQVKGQLGANAPAWDALDKVMPRFAAMSAALRASPNEDVRQSADDYISAAKALATAVKRRNAAGARGALKDLSTTCGDCHYKGGPGGKLDD